MIKKENLREECENYFARMDIEKFKEEMGIEDDEKNIVPDEDLAKVDENGNIIEE